MCIYQSCHITSSCLFEVNVGNNRGVVLKVSLMISRRLGMENIIRKGDEISLKYQSNVWLKENYTSKVIVSLQTIESRHLPSSIIKHNHFTDSDQIIFICHYGSVSQLID